jgi:hypothetical protein
MQQPFRPTPGATVNIDVSASSQRVLVAATGCVSVRVHNAGTAVAFIAFGDGAITATTTASVPVAAGTTEVLRFANTSGAPLYAAAIADGATGRIYFTPGDGI